MYNYHTLLVNDTLTGSIHAISKTVLHKEHLSGTVTIGDVSSKACTIYPDNSLQLAVEFMLKTQQDILPVLDRKSQAVIGMISEHDILKIFEQRFRDENDKHRHIFLKSSTIQAFQNGRSFFLNKKEKEY